MSIAGKRAGLEGERSGLFMEQIRVVKEMREQDKANGRTDEFIRPRYMVWENVEGALSSAGKGLPKGSDFQAVLTEIVKIAKPDAPDVPMPESGRWPKSGLLYGCGVGGGGSPLPIGYMMPSIGEFRSAEKGLLYSQILTDSQPERLCLVMNTGEMPIEAMNTKLSDILETNADRKYHLSARACQGILNRAEKRGKELPEILRTALINRIKTMESFTYDDSSDTED